MFFNHYLVEEVAVHLMLSDYQKRQALQHKCQFFQINTCFVLYNLYQNCTFGKNGFIPILLLNVYGTAPL